MMTDFFKGGGNHRSSEGLIEDGCKQTSKLISTGPQNAASNPIRSGCFPDVHAPKVVFWHYQFGHLHLGVYSLL